MCAWLHMHKQSSPKEDQPFFSRCRLVQADFVWFPYEGSIPGVLVALLLFSEAMRWTIFNALNILPWPTIHLSLRELYFLSQDVLVYPYPATLSPYVDNAAQTI